MVPKLQFPESDIREIALRYKDTTEEDELMKTISIVRNRGYLKQEELKKLSYWKSPRCSRHISKNSDEYVQEITSYALSAKTERARIEVLTLLDGVYWPSASVVLHFYHIDPYPILDFRALWSVSLEVPNQYYFNFWWTYVQFCRELAEKNNKLDMRTLDRALWQYSKENQKN